MLSKILKSNIALLLAVVMVSCNTTPTNNEQNKEEQKNVGSINDSVEQAEVDTGKEVTVDIADISEFQEAPKLAELVASGELPPVEERMPVKEDIMIQPVFEEIGTYGGDLKMPWLGGNAEKWEAGRLTEESLFRFNQDGSDIEPNIAKGYDVNEDKTEYTIYLREGMKWSDGVPVTADDVIFWYEHLMLTEYFGKAPYECFYSIKLGETEEDSDKALMTMEKIDDYTVKMIHKYPSPLFLKRLAIDVKWAIAPKHFYEDMVPSIVGEEEALKVAQEWGFQDVTSFGKMIGYYFWIYPERPTLRPWVIINDSESNQAIFERNPYYWKVDEDGKQLPYIDRLVLDKFQDKSHFTLEALAGNVSINRYGMDDFTTLKENEANGDYNVRLWKKAGLTSSGFQLNQTVKDLELREIFQNVEFREALSIAIDREEVSEIVFDGLVEPAQFSIPEGRPFYKEEWVSQWTDRDVDKANEILDEMGIIWEDGKNYRTLPSGKEFAFSLHLVQETKQARYSELLTKYFKEIGILLEVKVVDKTFFEELKYSNELQAALGEEDVVDVSLRPDFIVPLRLLNVWYGNYGLYNQSNGEEGLKPEGDVAELQRLWNVVVSSTEQEDIDSAVEEIWDIHMRNQFVIGATGPIAEAIVVKNNLKNVPNQIVWADEYRCFGHAKPYQFFFKD